MRSGKYLLVILFMLIVFAILIGRFPGIPGVLHLDSVSGLTVAEPVALPTVTTMDSLVIKKQPSKSKEEQPEPLNKPVRVANPDSSYVFQNMNPDGSPVTFSPCRPVHFVINPENAPANGETLIMKTIGKVSNATGLTFVYDGVSQESPSKSRNGYQPKTYGDRWAPILIAWASLKSKPGDSADMVGEATSYQLVRGNGFAHYVTGQVVLDQKQILRMNEQYGQNITGSVIEHEMGHLIGLGHTAERNELMYHETQIGVSEYQAGDLTGLAELGQGACAPDL